MRSQQPGIAVFVDERILTLSRFGACQVVAPLLCIAAVPRAHEALYAVLVSSELLSERKDDLASNSLVPSRRGS